MRRAALAGLVAMIGLAITAPQRLTAQNDEVSGVKSESKAARRPLPAPFGRLGLSDSQKEELYSIKATYDERIAPLEEQIEQLKHERDATMETLLTPGQKLRLQELREEARARAASDPKSPPENAAQP